ncbi:MAG: hypothetical protein H7263_02170 [Candidatus Sericytochromatia bacterium]|nr:hypothetical protein [Candidatus Sericytochromatia bacterium]
MIYKLKDLNIQSITKKYNFKNQDIPDYLRNKEVSSGSKVFKLEGDGIEEWGHLNTTFFETIRPCNKELIDNIKQMYRKYLDFYIDYLDKKLQKIKIEQNNNDVNIYKEYHTQNSPGHGYLSKIFGNDCTRDYLSLFMYKVR